MCAACAWGLRLALRPSLINRSRSLLMFSSNSYSKILQSTRKAQTHSHARQVRSATRVSRPAAGITVTESLTHTSSPQVKKPPGDERLYKTITLHNGLQVLLISDPVTDMSAASMSIRAGTMNDPWSSQGLAHFHEHMLFMGTVKYPGESDYEDYVIENGGGCNAYTAMEETNYHFNIKHEAFDGALDRFAQFFITPVFDTSSIEREVQAVHSEHQDNMQDDGWREVQLLQSLSHNQHAFHKFGTGTVDTLLTPRTQADLRELLFAFHGQYYHGPGMKLAVLARESLTQLENMVTNRFAGVRAAPLANARERLYASDTFTDSSVAFGREQLGTKIEMVPVKSTKKLNLYFPVAPVEDHIYTKHGRFISHILGHEGPGSLRSELQKLGYLESLYAGLEMNIHNQFTIFCLGIELTEKGDVEHEKVLQHIFAYMNQLQVAGESLLRPMYEELSRELDLRFRFKEKTSPDSYVTALSDAMHVFPIADVISGPYTTQWNFEDLKRFIVGFVPENMILMRISNSLGTSGMMPSTSGWQQERWYGTDYKEQKLSKHDVADLSTIASPSLRLPDLNPFMPKDFSLRSSALSADGKYPKYSLSWDDVGTPLPAAVRESSSPFRYAPFLIFDTPAVRVWHKLDATYNVPRATLNVLFFHPILIESADNMARTVLLAETIQEEFNEIGYLAHKAGLHFSLSPTLEGIQIQVKGYSDGLPQLLQMLLQRMRDVPRILLADVSSLSSAERGRRDALETAYEERRQMLIREYGDMLKDQPYTVARYYVAQTLDKTGFSAQAIEQAMRSDSCSASGSAALFQKLLDRESDRGTIDIFCHGNMDALECMEVSTVVRDSLLTVQDHMNQTYATRSRTKSVQIPLDGVCVEIRSDIPSEVNTAVIVVQQTGQQFDYSRPGVEYRMPSVTLDFIAHIADKCAFQQLRTQQQLGYVAHASVRRSSNAQGLEVMVQSPWASADEIEQRIEGWLMTYLDTEIRQLTPKTFEDARAALKAMKTEKPAALFEEATSHWMKISGGNYNFGALEDDVECLDLLTIDDVISMWERYLRPGAQERRRLVVKVLPGTANAAQAPTDMDEVEGAMADDEVDGEVEDEMLHYTAAAEVSVAKAVPPVASIVLRDIDGVKSFVNNPSTELLDPIRVTRHRVVDLQQHPYPQTQTLNQPTGKNLGSTYY